MLKFLGLDGLGFADYYLYAAMVVGFITAVVMINVAVNDLRERTK